jgi:hypothetical protein
MSNPINQWDSLNLNLEFTNTQADSAVSTLLPYFPNKSLVSRGGEQATIIEHKLVLSGRNFRTKVNAPNSTNEKVMSINSLQNTYFVYLKKIILKEKIDSFLEISTGVSAFSSAQNILDQAKSFVKKEFDRLLYAGDSTGNGALTKGVATQALITNSMLNNPIELVKFILSKKMQYNNAVDRNPMSPVTIFVSGTPAEVILGGYFTGTASSILTELQNSGVSVEFLPNYIGAGDRIDLFAGDLYELKHGFTPDSTIPYGELREFRENTNAMIEGAVGYSSISLTSYKENPVLSFVPSGALKATTNSVENKSKSKSKDKAEVIEVVEEEVIEEVVVV